MTREFRGALYQIEVRNPDHVCSGVRSVMVDDQEIDGIVVRPLEGDQVHRVEVILGD